MRNLKPWTRCVGFFFPTGIHSTMSAKWRVANLAVALAPWLSWLKYALTKYSRRWSVQLKEKQRVSKAAGVRRWCQRPCIHNVFCHLYVLSCRKVLSSAPYTQICNKHSSLIRICCVKITRKTPRQPCMASFSQKESASTYTAPNTFAYAYPS